MTIVYKLVREDGKSLFYNENHLETLVFYHLHMKAWPRIPNSCLMAFDTLNNARKYSGYALSYAKLFKANAEIHPTYPSTAVSRYDTLALEFFWRSLSLGNPYPPYTMPAPKGTVFCNWIELLEELK